MNTTMKSLTAVLMATTFSTAAIAQSANVGADVSVGGNTGASVGADVSTGASGNAAASAQNNANVQANANAKNQNYGQLISGLQTGEVSAEMLSGVDAASDATIVVMSDLKGNAAENASALENALSKQDENISELRSSIEANTALREKLEAEGYSVDQVVAVNSTTSGEVTLVVDDNI